MAEKNKKKAASEELEAAAIETGLEGLEDMAAGADALETA